MIARWWFSRSARERALILAAGGLTALALLWFAAFAPALAARAQAQRAYLTAADLYAEMTAGARAAAQLRAAAPEAASGPADDQPLRTAAGLAARDLGLEISRIQPGENGAIAFVFDAADPQDLFRWVERLETRYGAPAAMVTMRRNDGARTVQANVLVLESQ